MICVRPEEVLAPRKRWRLAADGARLPSSTYLLRIEGDFGRDVRKLALVR
jgi:hypothetical protein